MSKTVIRSCGCSSEYQDAVYGKGMRVHNEGKGKNNDPVYRCTVCGAEKG